MNKLTVVIPNKNRLDINTNSTKWLLKSLQWQVCNDFFDVVFVDGGSNNYKEIKQFIESYNGKYSMKVLQKDIEGWNKCLLNNFGIKNATGEYILCTDADMIFAKNFISTVIENLEENTFIEAKTMYLKGFISNRIYSGELDPYNNLDTCKVGRIKRKTTCGGCQCTHIKNWTKLRGYNEEVAWLGEDQEILARAYRIQLNVKWIGEEWNNVMIFHQPHEVRNNTQEELNKKWSNRYLSRHPNLDINKNGWGGMS